MSRTEDADGWVDAAADDDRVGLGWEVWFLAALPVGGLLFTWILATFVGLGLELPETNPISAQGPELDPGRVVLGAVVAAALVAAAGWIIRRTDWRRD